MLVSFLTGPWFSLAIVQATQVLVPKGPELQDTLRCQAKDKEGLEYTRTLRVLRMRTELVKVKARVRVLCLRDGCMSWILPSTPSPLLCDRENNVSRHLPWHGGTLIVRCSAGLPCLASLRLAGLGPCGQACWCQAASGHEAEASGRTPWAWLGTHPCGQCPETSWLVQGSGRKYSRGQA